eukprot:jgi/Botrbrau1/10642/Bobra.53_2s0001.1
MVQTAAGGGPAGPSDDDTVAVAVCRHPAGVGERRRSRRGAVRLVRRFWGSNPSRSCLRIGSWWWRRVRAQIVAQRRAGEGGGEKAAMPSYAPLSASTSRDPEGSGQAGAQGQEARRPRQSRG